MFDNEVDVVTELDTDGVEESVFELVDELVNVGEKDDVPDVLGVNVPEVDMVVVDEGVTEKVTDELGEKVVDTDSDVESDNVAVPEPVCEKDELPETVEETVEEEDGLVVVVEDTESDSVVLADIVGLTDTDVDSELDGVPVIVV